MVPHVVSPEATGLDTQAFRELPIAEMDAVCRMAFHLARRADEAADLAQETYLRALKADGKFQLDEAKVVRPWLFRILHNTFYTRVSRQKRDPAFVEDISQEPVEPTVRQVWDIASLDWEEVDERLKQAIDELPDHYRIVLLLWAIEGLRYREVAEVMKIPLGTVMSRLHRARAILGTKLGDLAAEHGSAG